MKSGFVRAVLWLSVLSFGIQTGAATYEALVITPLWAGNPPASVRGWNPVAEFAIQPVRYWAPGGIALAVCTLGLLLAAAFRSSARRWCLVAGLSGLAVLLSTALFFVPILVKTIFDNGVTLSDAEIVSKVHAWVGWNWLRFAILLLGWLATVQGVASQRSVAPSQKL
jgi:hypothetical protein